MMKCLECKYYQGIIGKVKDKQGTIRNTIVSLCRVNEYQIISLTDLEVEDCNCFEKALIKVAK